MMACPDRLCDLPRVLTLVYVLFLKCECECVDWPRGRLLRYICHRTGIHAARKEHAQWHVADHVQADRFRQGLANLIYIRCFRFPAARHLPESLARKHATLSADKLHFAG